MGTGDFRPAAGLGFGRIQAGIAEGSWVRFTAKHIDGEATLTSIRATAECKRFQECG